MKNYQTKMFDISLRSGKSVVVFIIGGVVMHTVVMIFDYFLISEPMYINLRQNFVGSIFSRHMLPMVAVYGTSVLLIYSLWMRVNKTIHLVQQKELQREKVELVFKAMQQMTGIIVDHIAANNTDILRWVEHRKINGQKVSNRVEKPARNIAAALQSFSEVSFLGPYSDTIPENSGDIEKLLKSKLDSRIN